MVLNFLISAILSFFIVPYTVFSCIFSLCLVCLPAPVRFFCLLLPHLHPPLTLLRSSLFSFTSNLAVSTLFRPSYKKKQKNKTNKKQTKNCGYLLFTAALRQVEPERQKQKGRFKDKGERCREKAERKDKQNKKEQNFESNKWGDEIQRKVSRCGGLVFLFWGFFWVLLVSCLFLFYFESLFLCALSSALHPIGPDHCHLCLVISVCMHCLVFPASWLVHLFCTAQFSPVLFSTDYLPVHLGSCFVAALLFLCSLWTYPI